MITGYVLRRVGEPHEDYDGLVWIDLLNPSDAEEDDLEKWLGVDIPTKDEMEEIEISSRLYSKRPVGTVLTRRRSGYAVPDARIFATDELY